MSERKLYAKLTVGSNLFGTQTPDSDYDWLELLIPSTRELVQNQRVTIPQRINKHVDTRAMLLGGFVTSLGGNVENMATAYHYQEYFGPIQQYWLRRESLQKMLAVSMNMWNNAKTPKNLAHAYRYAYTADVMGDGADFPAYPMTDHPREIYMGLRNGLDTCLKDARFFQYLMMVQEDVDNSKTLSDDSVDYDKLAEWVMLRYLGLAQ